MTTTTNLLALARQRRLTALATLKSREDNLFALADHRMQAATRGKPMPIFSSSRTERVTLSLVKPEDRLAA